MLALQLLKLLFIDQSVALLHFLSILILLFSFKYYFLSTGILNKKKFFLISFIFIFNPLTLQLVTHNTRQLFFTSLISLPFNYLCVYYLRNLYKEKKVKTEKILKNKILPILSMLFGFSSF